MIIIYRLFEFIQLLNITPFVNLKIKNKICLKVSKVHNRKLLGINTNIEEQRMELSTHQFRKKRKEDKLSTLCMTREFLEETLITKMF